MATSVEKYTEGGIPSNMQVLGVRVADLASVQLEAGLVVLGDTYNLFNLSADEVVLNIGVDNRSAAAASTEVEVNVDAVANVLLAAVDLTVVGKTLGTAIAPGTTGVVNVIVTGGAGGGLDIDFGIYAVVARVVSPTTQTAIDTPAP
jgi:hypothetical protein